VGHAGGAGGAVDRPGKLALGRQIQTYEVVVATTRYEFCANPVVEANSGLGVAVTIQ